MQKNWIKKVGALHKTLGIKAEKEEPTVKREAVLAQVLTKLRK